MNIKRHIYSTITCLSILTGISGLAPSCSMMDEDRSDCPTGLYVRFTYDYNIQRADMFKDHVGCVKLYVYNEAGALVAERTVSNTDSEQPLKQYGYTIHFNEGELADGRYRLQAVGLQKDWEASLGTPGAKYRISAPTRSDELLVSLDHGEMVDAHHPVSAEAPLDTLWHTLKVSSLPPRDGTEIAPIAPTVKPFSIYPLEDQYVTVTSGMATYATVSMIRNTNHVNIILHQIDDPDNIFHTDFDVALTDRNKTVGHDNELTDATPLRYTPYHSWTTRYGANGTEHDPGSRDESDGQGDGQGDGEVLQRTAHYNIMCNRLMHTNDMSQAAILNIVNLHSGKTVANINLPSMLAEARMAYATYNYSPQEYLDREYDYHLHFFLKGDTWYYCDIVLNVLSWSKRTYNVNLE